MCYGVQYGFPLRVGPIQNSILDTEKFVWYAGPLSTRPECVGQNPGSDPTGHASRFLPSLTSEPRVDQDALPTLKPSLQTLS